MKYIRLTSPFLVAILSVTSMWAANAPRVEGFQMGTPLIYAALVAGFFLFVFWAAHWTGHSAPLAASVFTFCFLIWYEIHWLLNVWFMICALVLCTMSSLKPIVRNIQNALPFILVVIIEVTLVAGAIKGVPMDDLVDDYIHTEGKTNIYFIVPDRMPSPEAMAETGIDCTETVEALQSIGFIVPWGLMSSDPYTWDYSGKVSTTRTMRFFAEVLNDGEPVPIDIDYSECRCLIRAPEIFKELHNAGYKITNVGSWFYETANFPTADINLQYEDVSFIENLLSQEFNRAYYERTIISRLNFKVWEPGSSIQRVERGRHQWQANSIITIAQSGETSQFVISHILLPHEPFVYSDWFSDSVDNPDQMQQYIYQIRFALDYILDLATEIREADPGAYIIIQSDEGMAFRKPKSINEGLSDVQWSGVFGAWYFPDREVEPDWVPAEFYEILREVSYYG